MVMIGRHRAGRAYQGIGRLAGGEQGMVREVLTEHHQEIGAD
jgi:hypothetical protein